MVTNYVTVIFDEDGRLSHVFYTSEAEKQRYLDGRPEHTAYDISYEEFAAQRALARNAQGPGYILRLDDFSTLREGMVADDYNI